ncbi:MFS transporter [Methylobacterium terricola]|uniref:MFS transporter n=1 Tax=Methylobacterium terricola TaxID=2583531 RepID=A0A5C4L9N9_9HYPH|nr:MFS transporter [Methylobacterium terricola]TNC07505.1 MFS transporter [Methylobacterium terricola]
MPAALPRFLLVYAALYAGYGLTTPFLPALLNQRGLSPTEVGLVLAAGTGIRLAAGPFAGLIADRLAAGRGVLAVFAALSASSALLYLAGHGFAGLLLAGLAHAAATAPLAPLADALALPAAAACRFAYGTVRGAGSAAFIAGTLAAGQAVALLGLSALPVAGALAFAALAGASLRLPTATTGDAGTPATAGAGMLLRSRPFLRLVAVAALVIGSHAVHDAFAVIRWRGAGLGAMTVSLLWAEAVAAEVLVFLVLGPPLLARIGPGGALALAAGAGILRWSAAALTVALPALVAIQALHGLTFALLHLAAMRILARTVPPGLAATAQTLYGTLGLGLATTLATLAAGPLYDRLGAGAFWVMAAACAAALPLVRGLGGREPDEPGPDGRGLDRDTGRSRAS